MPLESSGLGLLYNLLPTEFTQNLLYLILLTLWTIWNYALNNGNIVADCTMFLRMNLQDRHGTKQCTIICMLYTWTMQGRNKWVCMSVKWPRRTENVLQTAFMGAILWALELSFHLITGGQLNRSKTWWIQGSIDPQDGKQIRMNPKVDRSKCRWIQGSTDPRVDGSKNRWIRVRVRFG